MSYKMLRKLKNNFSNHKELYGFDVETFHIQREGYIEQKFLMGSVVGHKLQKIFWNKEEMADFMTARRFHGSNFFAHNMEFDWTHVFQDSRHLEKMFPLEHNGIIYAKYRPDKYWNHRIEYFDTMNYSGRIGLAEIGKLVGISKLKKPKCLARKPKNSAEKYELERYNIQDSLITYMYAKFIQKFCNKLGCKMKMTIASIGLDNWRRNYQPFNLFQEPRYIIEKHFKGAFHGGRVELFKRGYIEDAYLYDYNSHYPSCCYEGIDGKGSYPNPSTHFSIDKSSFSYLENYEGITKAKVRAKNIYAQLLGITYTEDKYIFPYGEFTGWFTNIELRKALELGYEITEFYEGIYYEEIFKPFRECVSKLYGSRKRYQKNKNIPMGTMLKTLMNAGLFGKFAQKINTSTNVIHQSRIFIDDDDELYWIDSEGRKKIIDTFVQRGDYFFESIENPLKIPCFIMPILASYTTALGRIKLFESMNDIQNLIYCDTDCIVTHKKMGNGSSKLGELKLEHRIKKAVFVRPKMYYINTEADEIIKIKGVGRAIQTKKDFNRLLRTGKVKTMRFTRIKESAVRKLPFSSVIAVEKHLGFEDNKRLWPSRFSNISEQDSEPIKLKMSSAY